MSFHVPEPVPDGLGEAAAELRANEWRDLETSTYVIVELPIGEVSYPRARMDFDIHDEGALVISHCETWEEIDRWPAGSWARAKTFSSRMKTLLFAFQAALPIEFPRR